ncbi:MAG TPA: EAL domain-containing protein [Burkholderiaceae bacterium]|nr:EAL domain-containing protein [Burkholderiaceae bacterium]
MQKQTSAAGLYKWMRRNPGHGSTRARRPEESDGRVAADHPARRHGDQAAAPHLGAGLRRLARRPEFKLQRYLSLTSLLGVAAVIVGLLMFNRHLAFKTLMEHEARSNEALTRAFANTHWPQYSAFVEGAHGLDAEALAKHPDNARLRLAVLAQMKGLSVVKVKVYDLGGLTVFSTDPKQIGEDKSRNAGFLSAKAGRTASDIAFRHKFDAFEEVINDRNLVSSYVPIRGGASGQVQGVFEIYSDVSDLVAQLEATHWRIVGAVVGSLSLLYVFLFLLVRRADRILSAQSDAERQVSQEQLRHQAYHDPLTGLPNRARFAERLDDAIRYAKRNARIFAVLFIDLDHFKYVNDSLGHVVGDDLLRAVAARLTGALRDSDTVARLGGDEFILLLPEIGRIDHAARLAEKILAVVSGEPYVIDGRELRINPSIGISVYPDDGEDAVTLIKNADAAMYYAKEMGRNNFQFFTQDMNARAFAVLSIEHSLRQAVERKEFRVHYQPQLDRAGRIVGLEALVRWQHPEMGLVAPTQFIPIAEERGLVVPIGEWVLREACRQNKAWQDAGLPAVPVGVNVSALQFRLQDFPDRVAAALQETGLAPHFLELEITESVIMHGADAAIGTVRRLKAMGVKLSIDDFGTGYSSLSYLKQFPIDKLKLDQSFVRGLPSNPDDMAISSAVLGMAKALNLKVIAEGVENRAQMDFLFARACDEVQGYYVTRPLPPEELARFIAEHQRAERAVAEAPPPASR